jgi:hypothetical protein
VLSFEKLTLAELTINSSASVFGGKRTLVHADGPAEDDAVFIEGYVVDVYGKSGGRGHALPQAEALPAPFGAVPAEMNRELSAFRAAINDYRVGFWGQK